MTAENRWAEIEGIRMVLAENPAWPSPANVFIITDHNGFALIDAGCGEPAGWDFLQEGLNHWGLDLQDLHTVVLSHSHPDHMGGLGRILEKVRPTVIIHQLDAASALNPEDLIMNFDIPLARKRYTAADRAAFDNFDLLASFEMYGCAMSAASRIEKVIEGDVIELGDFSFEVVHTPGHSPGHMALFDAGKRLLLAGQGKRI
jgi:glyoxylase-like metal-dependent hydrolase (beta-lactamase superfamily II)